MCAQCRKRICEQRKREACKQRKMEICEKRRELGQDLLPVLKVSVDCCGGHEARHQVFIWFLLLFQLLGQVQLCWIELTWNKEWVECWVGARSAVHLVIFIAGVPGGLIVRLLHLGGDVGITADE